MYIESLFTFDFSDIFGLITNAKKKLVMKPSIWITDSGRKVKQAPTWSTLH